MKRHAPTLWLCFGLVSLTMAIMLTAYVLGLMPDGYKAELEARAKVAESLAVQIAGAVNRKDSLVLQETLDSVVKRNPDVLSGALRRVDGGVIMSSGDHEKFWVPAEDGKSTATHVTVPLFGAQGQQSSIELSFGPVSNAKRIWGIPASLLMLLAFIMGTGFIAYFILLRRTLKELDPSRVIPERVQKSFDTLSDGVVILDEKERILLINRAFASFYGEKAQSIIGKKINTLSWRMVDGSAKSGGYPWHLALRDNEEKMQDLLSLRTADGDLFNFKVCATVIASEKNKTIGAIVTLTDMTTLKRSKDDLEKTREQLEESRILFDQQKGKLDYLSNYDSLTDCLNRTTLYRRLEETIDQIEEGGDGVVAVMVGIDHMSAINDTHGRAIGDNMLIGIADLLNDQTEEPAYVARYAGDEFCCVMPEGGLKSSLDKAEAMREQIFEGAAGLLPDSRGMSVSIGIAHTEARDCPVDDLINRACQALWNAKQDGRNSTVVWVKDLPRVESFGDGEARLLGEVAERNIAQLEAVHDAMSYDAASSEQNGQSTPGEYDAFAQTIKQSITRSQKNGRPFALVHLSVSAWDYFVEALGDALSKRLMRAIKREALATLPKQDEMFAISLEGELIINLSEFDDREAVVRQVVRLLNVLSVPVKVDGNEYSVSCYAGVAIFPDNGRDARTLMRHAGMAMRRARDEDMREGYAVFSTEMMNASKERLNIESGIRDALDKDEFELHFQPIADINSGALAAAEALLRCTSSAMSHLRIDQIVDVAELSPLMSRIDLWVLNRALIHMEDWVEQGIDLPKISINLSASQLTDVGFMDQVFDRINAVSFAPSRVQIEVTETAKLSDVELAATQIKRLQHLGVQIALDDFGTGQSSLTYLQRLHPDVIKIDRSFVTGVNHNHANATLVSAMTVMAHCLGLKVVVEGVEEFEELEFLRETRCDQVQGYFVSKPMAESDMTAWMKAFISENGTMEFVGERRLESDEDLPDSIDRDAA